jgi:hypothetical protein
LYIEAVESSQTQSSKVMIDIEVVTIWCIFHWTS